MVGTSARRATTPRVAVAWLRHLGLARSGTELPDHTGWGGTSWVQAAAFVGGNPDPQSGMRQPVVQFDCWAADTQGRALWTVADELAEELVDGCADGLRVPLPMPTGCPPTLLHAAVARTDPARVGGDVDHYARVRIDVQLYWTAQR